MKPRGPGRPAIDHANQPARVHVTLSSRDYNQADSLAKRDGLSVPELMRRGLARVLTDESEDDE